MAEERAGEEEVQTESEKQKIPLLAQLVYGSYSEDRSKLILSHDHGVGSPCGKCNNCSGLELHFWRKICKNCGCQFEDHDIKVDESIHETIVYNLLNMTDNLSSFEIDSEDEEELEKHPILKEFCKKKAGLLPPPVAKKPPNDGGARKISIQASLTNGISDETKSTSRLLPPPVAKKPCGDGSRKTSIQVSSSSDDSDEKKDTDKYNDEQVSRELPEKRKQAQILLRQIPVQDFDPKYCHDLDTFETNELKYFRFLVQEEAIGKATTKSNNFDHDFNCEHCKKSITPKENYKFVERLPSKKWHPNCFKCHECSSQLAASIYFVHENNIYCGRHYAENLKNRCAACDELIFSQKYTNAENRDWHTKHFCCYKCDAALANKYYVVVENQPYCVLCYNNAVADRCNACLQPIQAGTERINFESFDWHVNPNCFACTECRKSLINQPFIPSGGKLFCSQLCVGVYSI